MPTKRTAPTIENGKYKHPSYATARFSRCSGQKELFNSSMQHQHFITLTICEADKEVTGERDWVFGHKEIIEVAMSEAQFASLITTLNMGSGVPCTIQHIGGEFVEQPLGEDRINSHRDMVKEALTGKLDALKGTLAKLRLMRKHKKRPTLKELDEIVSSFAHHVDNFERNMEYYAGCFEEHAEQVVADAKAEVEAFVSQTMMATGIEAHAQLKLENKDD